MTSGYQNCFKLTTELVSACQRKHFCNTLSFCCTLCVDLSLQCHSSKYQSEFLKAFDLFFFSKLLSMIVLFNHRSIGISTTTCLNSSSIVAYETESSKFTSFRIERRLCTRSVTQVDTSAL